MTLKLEDEKQDDAANAAFEAEANFIIAVLARRAAEQSRTAADLRTEVSRLATALQERDSQYQAAIISRSWRITAPARLLSALLRKLFS